MSELFELSAFNQEIERVDRELILERKRLELAQLKAQREAFAALERTQGEQHECK